MAAAIHINDAKAKRTLNRLAALENDIRTLLQELIVELRRRSQINMLTEGKQFGAWAPASKWHKAKHGDRRMFEGYEKHIKSRVIAAERAELFFEGAAPWTLSQHQEGFVEVPTGGRVTLDLVAPHHLALKSNQISFISRRPSRVPARRMWPNETQAHQYMAPLILQWTQRVEARAAA